MYAKFKTNLIGLTVALGFVLVGYGFGEPPTASQSLDVSPDTLAQADEATPGPARRGALKHQLAMPYVSIAALLPRQES
ncbi:MAG TPA: hypothetical protein VFQ84_06340 [Arenimonas sp.]|uniref:hypothetical protein n=1 Tax=Arenimonas sp. TaxID=1872635 RepID=UPI002D805AC3|nr:hypothetical protein [Arenimonas sp.]HEU0152945.1 hypothetical protein [Arenimonas sp.]